ncbi:hypothetical protein ACFE04_018484 [Oxalis oulophora]
MDETNLSFPVSNLKATFANSEMTIYATLHLSSDMLSTNQAWQEGPVTNGKPGAHSTSGANLKSVGSIDFRSGVSTTGLSSTASTKSVAHGVLCTLTWALLMPIGVMIARYVKVFKSANPAWFYLHIGIQSLAFVVGVAGSVIGLKLSDPVGIKLSNVDRHRSIGVVVFFFGILQMLAFLLRPKPDHKYRFYWNIYHHVFGYATIILSIANVFEGFDLLTSKEKSKQIYIGILASLGIISAVLEALTWYIVIKRKKADSV